MPVTYHEQLRRLVADYQGDGNSGPFSSYDVARWAFIGKRYQPEPSDVIKRLARDISEALRHEHFLDECGRPVRAKHAARSKQVTLWDDIRTAPRKHMQLSFAQRRGQIASDCFKLKVDVDFYNNHHPEEEPIQLVLDFDRDVVMKELEYEEKKAIPNAILN